MTDRQDELIPELHDVLKITKLKHNVTNFSNFTDNQLQTPTWEGVMRHHCAKHFKLFPNNIDTFRLCLADNQAANLGRQLRQEYYTETGEDYIYKLWNPSASKNKTIKLLESDDKIKTLLQFMSTNPTFEEFKKKYENILLHRPEDKSIGRNITSLLSHMTVTGKIYRLLRDSNNYPFEAPADWNTKQVICDLIRQKEKDWQIYIAALQFDFYQNPFRVKDFAVFDFLQEVMDKIVKDFPDNILMRFDNRLMVMYDTPQIIEAIVRLSRDLRVTEISASASFDELKYPDPYNLKGKQSPAPPRIQSHPNLDLPDSIRPPLCEICQMAPGQVVIAEDRQEELCPQCIIIRQRPLRLHKLARWSDDEEEDVLVAWIHHSLNYSGLLEALKKLYLEYLQRFITDMKKSTEAQKKEMTEALQMQGAQIRFSVLEEFSRDYEGLVKGFNQTVKDRFSANPRDGFEPVNSWLACVKLAGRSEVFDILKDYDAALQFWFPKLAELSPCPFSLRIAISGAKFPFFQVWRQINKAEREIEIALMGHGVVALDHCRLATLFKAIDGKYKKSALHALAEIAKTSEQLARIKFSNRDDREDHPTYQHIHELVMKPLGMDFRSMLTFAQLLED